MDEATVRTQVQQLKDQMDKGVGVSREQLDRLGDALDAKPAAPERVADPPTGEPAAPATTEPPPTEPPPSSEPATATGGTESAGYGAPGGMAPV